MDKFNVKIMAAFLLILVGCLACFITFFVVDDYTSHLITWLVIGGTIFLLGLSITLSLSREQTLMMKLKSGKIPLLARWSYQPHDYPMLKQQLQQDRQVTTIFILLIGASALLVTIVMGISDPAITPLSATPIGILIIILCIIWFMHIQNRYYKLLSNDCETLISDHYFLFNNELYTLQKGAYELLSVSILTRAKNYIQLEYGLPGTSYTSLFHVLIPIPDEDILTAHLIVSLYTDAINQHLLYKKQ